MKNIIHAASHRAPGELGQVIIHRRRTSTRTPNLNVMSSIHASCAVLSSPTSNSFFRPPSAASTQSARRSVTSSPRARLFPLPASHFLPAQQNATQTTLFQFVSGGVLEELVLV